jgi:transcriptional regulator with XRE-family HTH domain
MIYDTVKLLAYKRGLTIADVERRAKLSNGTIGGWKDGDPRLSSIKKVAKALNVSAYTLIKD